MSASESDGNPKLAAALSYAARGWFVLHLHAPDTLMGCSCEWRGCQKPGKHPIGRHGLDDATKDEKVIRSLWARYPFANVGVRTGSVSGLVVLDVDTRHGGDDSLADLVSKHGQLPATVEAQTGGGGRHFFFSHPGVPVQNQIGRLGAGLDLKGDGGYIVVAPSRHASGSLYTWELSSHPDETTLAPPPRWLFERTTKASVKAGRSSAEWRELVASGAVEGERNARIASLAGHLLVRGIDPFVTLDLLMCWNATRSKPPLSDDEVLQTVNSIARRERIRREGGNGRG